MPPKFSEVLPDQSILPGQSAPFTNVGGQRVSRDNAANERSYREKIAQLLRRGVVPATVVTLQSFPLQVNLGFAGYINIPAKEVGKTFREYVIKDFRIDRRDMGDNKMDPQEILPLELAQEVIREYGETGGVFCYEGETRPANFEALLNEHMDKQLEWFQKLYHDAEKDTGAHGGSQLYVNDRQRDAAKELFARGIIDKQPTWLSVSQKESLTTACEACGDSLKKTAKICPKCNFIVDAEWAKAKMPMLYAKQFGDLEPTGNNFAIDASDPEIAEMEETGKPKRTMFGKAGKRIDSD